jgi:argininosuccinate synthase
MQRIVLAHSGGLETSVAIPWLAQRFNAEIVAVTMDLGQAGELVGIRERALALGAVRCHVLDVREQFGRDIIVPSLQAGATGNDRSPLTAALGHALIAKKLVEIARMEGASSIAHGCVGDGADQARIETSARSLDPSLEVIAPARIWNMSRSDVLEYARAHSVPVPAFNESYVTNLNLWGRTISYAVEDSGAAPPAEIYALTRSPNDCPDQPAYVEIEFDAGVPIRANGIEMGFLELIESLETIAGSHGVGRIDAGENGPTGLRSRQIVEAPAAVVLHSAHRELEQLVIGDDLQRLKHDVARTYAELIENGRWFSHTREALDAFVAAIQPRVTGVVTLELLKGSHRVVSRRSTLALPGRELAATRS